MFHVAAKNTPLVRPPARSGLLLFMHRRGKTPFFCLLYCSLLYYFIFFFLHRCSFAQMHARGDDRHLAPFSELLVPSRRVALGGNATSAPDSSFLLARAHAYSTGQLTSLLAARAALRCSPRLETRNQLQPAAPYFQLLLPFFSRGLFSFSFTQTFEISKKIYIYIKFIYIYIYLSRIKKGKEKQKKKNPSHTGKQVHTSASRTV